MSKVSIIGAGNVGSLTALRIIQEDLAKVVLVDIAKHIACGKAFDLMDARAIFKKDYFIKGTDDFSQIKGSKIIIITAGFSRKPGMTRNELLNKNVKVIEYITRKIKRFAKGAFIIVVTNPVDIMTYLVIKRGNFNPRRVLGIGPTLDSSRFANLISQELGIEISKIRTMVIGAHDDTMLPLARFSYIDKKPLTKIISKKKIDFLTKKVIFRGAEIVSLLGQGSAYFAPSAAVWEIVETILKNRNKTLSCSVYLNGQYNLKDICIGVPVRLNKNGIEKIIELNLNLQEKILFYKSAQSIRDNINKIFN